MNPHPAKANTSTILIAEDQEDILENLSDYLSMRGYHTLQARNGKEAFQLALEQGPDLIISDLGMPVWDGNRLLEALQERPELARIPFVILTAWADRQNMRRGLQTGATDYITKPFTLKEIEEAVKSHLGRKQRLEETIDTYTRTQLMPKILSHLPHELRTPMNGILAPSELLMGVDKNVTIEEVREVGGIINGSATRMLRAVENIHYYLYLQTCSDDGIKSEFEEGNGCDNPMRLFKQATDKCLHYYSFAADRLHCSGSISETKRVNKQLEKVFEEILCNACQYASPESRVDVNWQEEGDRGILTIVNQGHGFDVHEINKSKAFYQCDRDKQEQQGLGLGLYIAKKIAAMHQTTISFESSKSGPTRAQIDFPFILR